jgi:protein-disulfide isomerase
MKHKNADQNEDLELETIDQEHKHTKHTEHKEKESHSKKDHSYHNSNNDHLESHSNNHSKKTTQNLESGEAGEGKTETKAHKNHQKKEAYENNLDEFLELEKDMDVDTDSIDLEKEGEGQTDEPKPTETKPDQSQEEGKIAIKFQIPDYLLPAFTIFLSFFILGTLMFQVNSFQNELIKTDATLNTIIRQNSNLESKISKIEKKISDMEKVQENSQNAIINQPNNLPSQNPSQVAPARPTTGKTSMTNQPFLGNKNTAKVAIVEFSDYECPFCKQFHSLTFDSIVKNFVDTGKIVYVSRDLPLPFHNPLAEYQAKVGECVFQKLGNQKYYEYSKNIYQTTTSGGSGMTNAKVDEIAIQTGLSDVAGCIADPKISQAVKTDQTDAGLAGVNGTPGFIVGVIGADGSVDGEIVSGAMPYTSFETAINNQLQKVGN